MDSDIIASYAGKKGVVGIIPIKTDIPNIKEEIICSVEISNFHGIRGKFISTEELILKENECCYFEKGELYGYNITDMHHTRETFTREYYKKVIFSNLSENLTFSQCEIKFKPDLYFYLTSLTFKDSKVIGEDLRIKKLLLQSSKAKLKSCEVKYLSLTDFSRIKFKGMREVIECQVSHASKIKFKGLLNSLVMVDGCKGKLKLFKNIVLDITASKLKIISKNKISGVLKEKSSLKTNSSDTEYIEI